MQKVSRFAIAKNVILLLLGIGFILSALNLLVTIILGIYYYIFPTSNLIKEIANNSKIFSVLTELLSKSTGAFYWLYLGVGVFFMIAFYEFGTYIFRVYMKELLDWHKNGQL